MSTHNVFPARDVDQQAGSTNDGTNETAPEETTVLVDRENDTATEPIVKAAGMDVCPFRREYGYSVSSADTGLGEGSSSGAQPSGSDGSYDDGDVEVVGPSLAQRARRKIRSTCTTKLVKRRLPFVQWLPRCTLQSVFYDCIAGFTAALTAIPQGIAYAAVAGLPLEYGLYTAFAGPFMYTLFGSVSQITMGPTAVMAIMTHTYTQMGGAPYAIMLSFLAGCIELLAGLLNLGFLMDFISGPVISGFCSAAAVTVITAQFKSILGLTFKGSSFAKVFPGLFTHWDEIKLWDTVLGFSFIILLLLLKNITDVKTWFSRTCCLHRPTVDRAVWFLSTCRNALAVIFGCILAYVLDLYGYQPFNLTGTINSGIPSFHMPPFSFERPVIPLVPFNVSTNWTDIIANQTYELVTFDTILSDLGTGLALVPIIAILEQVAIAKAFSNGGKTDSTQEMIACGLSSIFGSLFGCMPMTASFSRSLVLSASGGKTQLASFFNGCVILMALAFLMPTFYYIPKSVLGAVIITAVYPMVEYHELLPMWRGRRVELLPFLTTFICCLLINMEYGILIGAQLHLLILAYESSRTKSICTSQQEGGGEERILLRPDRGLYFPSVDRFRNALTKASLFKPSKRFIMIDLSRVTQIDYTSLKTLKSMLANWDKKGDRYCFVNVELAVKTSLRSILPPGVSITSTNLPVVDTAISFADETNPIKKE